MEGLLATILLFSTDSTVAQFVPAQDAEPACGPQIINARGDIEFDCSNELPEEVRVELASLVDNHNRLSASIDSEVRELNEDAARLRTSPRLASEEIARISSKLARVDEKMEGWRREQFVVQGNILDIVRDLEVDLGSYRRQLSAASREQFLRLESQANHVRASLARMEMRILQVETDVSALMDEVFSGKYDDSIFFYGFSAGALHSDDGEYPFFGLNAEWVLPKWMFGLTNAITGEIVTLNWEETVEFETLPGLPDREITTDRDVVLAGGGLKIFLTGGRFPIYTGATLGYAFEDFETWYFGLPLGIEYFTRSARLLLEYRFNYFAALETREVRFDNFGDAEITESEDSANTHMFSIKLLFR